MKSRLSGVLKEAEAGVPVKDLCRRRGNQRRHVLPLEGEVRWPGSERDQAAALARRRGERATEEDCCPAGIGSGRAEGGTGKKVSRPAGEARKRCVSYGKK